MSKRHTANRRRTYGRRQHELHERLDRRADRRPDRTGRVTHDARVSTPSGTSRRRAATSRTASRTDGRLPGCAPARPAPVRPRRDHGAGIEPGRRAAARRGPGRPPSKVARETAVPNPSAVAVGIALAAIVIVFSAAFLSLSQSVRVAATGYDIVRLVSEQDRLEADPGQDLQSDVVRLRSEPAIRKQALDAGLGQLGAPAHHPRPLAADAVLGRTDSGRRLLVVLIGFFVAASTLVVRLGYWQVSQHDQLVESASAPDLSPHGGPEPPRPDLRSQRHGRARGQRDARSADRLGPADERGAARRRWTAFLTAQLGLDVAAAVDMRREARNREAVSRPARNLPPERSQAIEAAAERGRDRRDLTSNRTRFGATRHRRQPEQHASPPS